MEEARKNFPSKDWVETRLSKKNSWRNARVQRSNYDGTVKIGQKRPGGSCSEADSSSSFGWLVAWLAGSAGSGSSSGSSSNSQNSQTGASPSSPAAIYIGSNHAATPTASSRRYDSSSNGLYPFHLSASLAFFSGFPCNNRAYNRIRVFIRGRSFLVKFGRLALEAKIYSNEYCAKVSFEILFVILIKYEGKRVFACDWINTSWMAFLNITCYLCKLCFSL